VSYITLRGRWSDIILNVHASTEGISDEMKDSFYEESERVFNEFPMYHVNILLRDFSAKAEKQDIQTNSRE